MSNQETKEDLPAENGETINKEGLASDEVGGKKTPSPINIMYHILPVASVSLLIQPGGVFLSGIL